MGRYTLKYGNAEIDRRLTDVDQRWGAAYFDAVTYRWLGFKDESDKAEYIASGDESLIIGEPVPFSFSGTVSQVKIINEMPSGNLYFTTQATEALLTCSFLSQEKGITDSAWTDVIEDFYVSVAIDRGGVGDYTDLIVDQLVLNGNSLTFDVRAGLASGNNRVRVVARGAQSGASASFTYTVNLTSMYLSPSNFTWYTPFIEGATYNLGGMNIGGNLQKVLRIKVAKEGYEKLYEVNLGNATYITNAYVFTGLEFPASGTGIYNVELWLDANGLESEHLKYNIICVSQADQYTARLISVSEQPDKVFNFAENSLFKYAIYNAGAATGTPHVEVSSIVKNTPTVLVDEDLVDVPTGAPLDYTVAIEIETEEADVQLDAVITFGNEQQTIYVVDNSKSYPATAGSVFYINPAIRSNAQENKDKIVNAVDSREYAATFEYMAWTDGTDGWTTDNAGRKCLRLPARSVCNIPYQPFANMSGSKTIEFTYKVENAADYDEPIITICDDPTSAEFRGIKITPKQIAIHSRDKKDTELQNYKPTDEETLNIIVSVIPNYKTNYGNLVKVWCNGSPVREFSFESNDSWLHSGNIILGSQTADLFLYKLRVYESAFGFPNAMANFINSLPTAEDKAAMQAKLNAAIDDSYKLDYDACVKAGLNTMVIEMLGEATLPDLLHPSSGQCNLWINILNKIDGELDAKMSELLSNIAILDQTIEGQGTTAMTYGRWNFRWKLGSAYDKRRITAKKNVASSMQSHKMGATRMFNHLHRAVVGENIVEKDVAVSQYPVFGFQKVKIEGTTDQYNYVPIGLYTVGADKGDKPTFGFDDERYESSLIHLEGTDHTPMAVGMDYPWSATRYDASKEAMGAIGNTGDVVAAWEVGAAGEYEPDATADQANVQAMLDAEFKPAYEVAYKNSPYILGVTETLAQINADVAAWRRRTTADGKSYSLFEFYTIGTYDVYYYNTQTQRYEANGINLLTDLGLSSGATNEDIIAARKARFKANWGNYWNTDDSIFHYTFCLIFAATDNYKKNTYPYKFRLLANGGRWSWRADDLDTLFDINNQGLAAKAYSVLVGDQTSTGSGSIYRGDTSVFWTLIKETCQDEIKAMVHRIFNAMVSMSPYGNNTLEKVVGCVRRFFWDMAQDYFSASAYNNDTEWTYEDMWATAGAWKEVNPLSQALGGHYEAERDWVTMRVLFLASYYNYGPFGAVNDSFSDTSTGQLVYGGAGQHTFEITPAIDFNPTILRGQSELVTVSNRVKAGETVDLTVPDSSGADTRIYVQGADWFEDMGDLSQLEVSADNPSLAVGSKRMQRLKIGDEVAGNVTSNLKTLTMGANPSMMVVDARNLTSLTGTVDLSGLPRLRQALFGGTNVRSLGVASGSKVEHLQFGDGTTSLTLQNLKFLETLEIGDKSQIEFFCVENCEGFNPFDLLKEAYNLDSQSLKDIRIIGFVYDGDSTDADMLANLANDLDKNGNDHAYNGINSEGAPMNDAHPVIEGTLTIAGAVYEDAANDIRANYPNLTLIVEGGYYIRFADPLVEQICATNWGDGNGITKEQAANVTNFNQKFKGNTEMTTFEEARYFTGLTTLGNPYSPQFEGNTSLTKVSFRDARLSSSDFAMCRTFKNCSQLSEIDMTNMFVDGQVVSMYDTFRGTAIKNFKFPKMTYKQYLHGGESCAIFHSCKNLESVDMSDLMMDFSIGRPDNPTYSWGLVSMFYGCTSLTSIVWPQTKITGIVSIQSMFRDCTSIEYLDLSNIDGSDLVYVAGNNSAFRGCSSLKSMDLSWMITKSPLIITELFLGCTSLQNVTLRGKFSEAAAPFSGCTSLEKVIGLEDWDVSQCSSLRNCLNGLSAFKQDDDVLDLSKWYSEVSCNMAYFCNNCASIKDLRLGALKPSNLESAFKGMSNLESISFSMGFDTSLTTTFNSAFSSLSKIKHIDISNWSDTSAATLNSFYLFDGDYLLEEVNLPENFLPNVTGYGQFMWYNSNYAIKKFTGWFNVQKAKTYPDFQGAPQLRQIEMRNVGGNSEATSLNWSGRVKNWGVNSVEVPDAQQSIVSTFNHLYDRASAGYSAFTITLSANSLASLEEGMGDVGLWNVLQKGYTIANYSPYITFVDPIVASICATNWGDGTNIAKGQAALVTKWDRFWTNNKEITSFEETRYFYNVAKDTANGIFYNCSLLERVDFSTWEEFYVLYASHGGYFCNCTSLQSVKLPKRIRGSLNDAFRNTPMLSSFDFSNTEIVDIASCAYAFHQSGIESLDISDWDLSKTTSMSNMLCGCTQLKTVSGFKNLNTPLCTTAAGCFSGYTDDVTQLESLDISGWTLADGASVNLMFNRNVGLKYLNVGEGWGGNINLMGLFGYQQNARRQLERVDGWLDFSSTLSGENMISTFYYLRKLEIRNFGKVADFTKMPHFEWIYEWGVNSAEVPDAEDSFKNTMRYLFDRAGAGYSNLTITLSTNTKAILNADATLLAEVVAKGYTIA